MYDGGKIYVSDKPIRYYCVRCDTLYYGGDHCPDCREDWIVGWIIFSVILILVVGILVIGKVYGV